MGTEVDSVALATVIQLIIVSPMRRLEKVDSNIINMKEMKRTSNLE